MKLDLKKNRKRIIPMGEYVKIGVITFVEYDLPELERLVDAALRKEHLMWGAGHIVICKKDPSIEHVNRQFRSTKFAGMSWKEKQSDILSDITYLLVVGKTGEHRKKFDELSMSAAKSFNLRRRRYIAL